MLGEVEEPFVVDLVVDLVLIIYSVNIHRNFATNKNGKAKNKDTV